MKHPLKDTHPRVRAFRFAVFALAALVVLSLGFALIPAEKPAPAEPPLTERARAAAFTAAMDLRASGMELSSTGAADSAVLDPVVTLLTIQARALMSPALMSPAPETGAATPPASATPSSTAGPASVAGLVQALAGSGTARLKDAETADGGMARLLAGAGTAQILAAGRLAAATGVPVPEATAAATVEEVPAQETASPCPSPSAAASQKGARPGTAAGVREALAAVVTAEEEAAYGYQAALPRLGPAEAGPASEFLARHRELADTGEERLRLACGTAVPQQPGYVLDSAFLAAPAAGLGRLEAATLASYGALVALSQGQDRKWALSALQAAAGRALRWGTDPGAVPGLTLDVNQLPNLPAVTGRPAGTGPAPSSAESQALTGPSPLKEWS
ncbi:DUF4439 domain-containing protein [Arthrobacter sp. FW306-05-C]|uniref:DUF4439 domain-containing protein n=1 Tax=Arthrobacter TaxID=1663 RepID=UPI001EF0BF1F|nr:MULTISPECIES: DUF4439 domain-containing protein [Arthrobacter]MDP9988119.1 hypothetical protein [Arthrobacter oryzae]UKA68089.1 DUF4439 domain-containing protein [Arthrobacter sp. FW306-05-C]UKA72616.1 DUF4439 domain-containing protein [Arthrobacter sp. FW306-06-A]